MIAVDTNILVRLAVRDDQAQAEKALDLFSNNPVQIAKTVVLETEWVLRYKYDKNTAEISGFFRKLLGVATVMVEQEAQVALALGWFDAGMDFADALHLAAHPGADRFYTFDKDFSKVAKRADCQPAVCLLT